MKKLIMLFVFFLSGVSLSMESDTLTVLQMTDIHFCNLAGYHPRFVEKRNHYGNVAETFQSFLKDKPKQVNADLVVITGDLIDYYEAETARGPWQATQVEQFVPMLSVCPVPVYLTLGNHDIASYWIVDNEKDQFQVYVQRARADWIRNAPSFAQGTWYSRDVKVGNSEMHFIFLDNGYSLENGNYIEKIQLDWLKNDLKQSGDKPVIIFMHKYLPVKDYNNDGNVFNRDTQLEMTIENCSKDIFKILNDNSNIQALFTGHGHRSITEPIQFPAGHTILQIETAAFAQNTEKHWRVFKVTENSLILMETGGDRVEQVFEFNP